MSKRILITFGGTAYDRTTDLTVHNAPHMGADEVRVYDDAWLMQTAFYRDNLWLFQREPRYGFGWCSWKPYIILDAFSKSAPGDLILYVDADTYPINNLSPIFDFAQRDGIVLFEAQGCDNRRFTQRECFQAMKCDEEKYYSARHACGRFQCFQNRPLNEAFLKLWMAWSLCPDCQFSDTMEMKRALDRGDGGNRAGIQLPEFFRHSAEQSVLTLLAKKWDIPLHREACQFGWPPGAGCGLPEDSYPQLFVQEGTTLDKRDVSGSRYRNV